MVSDFEFIKRRVRVVISLVFVSAGLVSCSLFGPKGDNQNRGNVLDVPAQARKFDEPRKRILVLPFIDLQSQHSQETTEAARTAVLRQLKATDQFVLVSPTDFPKDLSQFIVNGEYTMKDIAPLANGLGVAAIVEGKVIEVKARRVGDQVGLIREVKARVEGSVRLRLFAPKSGRELINEVRSAEIEASTTRVGEYAYSDRFLQDDPKLVREVVSKAFQGLIPPIILTVKKLSWEGRVAMVTGDRIYINAGRLTGLQVGDILKVLEIGDEVFDPESGELIGRAPGRMKGTIEVVSYFGKDGSIAVVHSGAGFKEADQVELY